MRLLLASFALVAFLPMAGIRHASDSEVAARSGVSRVAPFLPGALTTLAGVRPAATPLAGPTALAVIRDASSVTLPWREVPGGLPAHDEQARWRLRHSTSSSNP